MSGMIKKIEILSLDELIGFVEALRKIQQKVRWKPGKDLIHLNKRRALKHLPESASVSAYEEIICKVVRNGRSIMYLYDFRGTHYYAARGVVDDNDWLVLFGAGGLMETAFPPENIDDYLAHRGFIFLGYIEEVLKWIKEVRK